jgi:hypothetical protein
MRRTPRGASSARYELCCLHLQATGGGRGGGSDRSDWPSLQGTIQGSGGGHIEAVQEDEGAGGGGQPVAVPGLRSTRGAGRKEDTVGEYVGVG